MSKNFYEALKERRSIYAISKESGVSNERIQEVINEAVLHTPSAFNSQSARVVVLFGENHNKLWDITEASLKKIVPEENFAPTKEKIDSFRNGYASVLFFEDQNVVKNLQEQFSLYKDNFPVWSQQSSGMLQYVIWTSLAVEGLGKYTAQASGIFMMMVVGGGVLPLIQQSISDSVGYMASYWLIIAALAYLLFYGLVGCKNVNKDIPVED